MWANNGLARHPGVGEHGLGRKTLCWVHDDELAHEVLGPVRDVLPRRVDEVEIGLACLLTVLMLPFRRFIVGQTLDCFCGICCSGAYFSKTKTTTAYELMGRRCAYLRADGLAGGFPHLLVRAVARGVEGVVPGRAARGVGVGGEELEGRVQGIKEGGAE